MKKKFTKILGVVLTLALLLSLGIMAAPVAAVPGTNAWGDIDLPSDEFEGTDITILAFDADGSTMYGAVDDDDWALMKSTDGGFTWDYTTMDFAWYDSVGGLGDIVDIVVSPAGDGVIYVAFENGTIYKVADEGAGGISVITTIKNEEGVNATKLYDIDVFYDAAGDDSNYVLAATDIDALVFKDAGLFEEWVPLSLIDYCGPDNIPGGGDDYVGVGVLEIAFAPDFATTSFIWAVFDIGNDNMDYYDGGDDVLALVSTVGTGTWNTVFDELIFDGGDTDEVIPASTYPVGMAFPTGYTSGDPYLYLALTDPGFGGGSDDGNIFLCVIDEVGGDSEADGLLLENDDVCSVAVYGEVILAGTTVIDAAVYRSDNGGDTFDYIDGPTGERYTYVYMAPGVFIPDEGLAYATTSGTNSALSRSVDGGQTWTQIGLIDVDMDHVYDVAFLTQGDVQAALLITREGMTRSLWRTPDITATDVMWERILAGPDDSGNVDYRFLDVEVSLNPDTVMLYVDDFESGWYNDFSILKSTDGGWNFTHWRSMPGDFEDINDWVVYDGSTIYCATDGGFYGTSRFGPATTAEMVGGDDLVSIALQPGFDPDDEDNQVIVVGNDDGGLFVSTDKGENWGTEFATDGGADVYVAFDAEFVSNGLIYYATEDSLVGQALVVGNAVSTASALTTELLDSNDAAAAAESFDGIIVAPDNALYVIGDNLEEVEDSFFVANGTIDIAGENQQVGEWSSIQVMSDATGEVATLEFSDFIDIEMIYGGPFFHNEVLVVVGDSLMFHDYSDEVWGDIQVQGLSSGATGYFEIDDGDYDAEPDLGDWWDAGETYHNETVSITSASLYADVNSGTIEFDNVELGGGDWIDGEMLDVIDWYLQADGSGHLGDDDDGVEVEGAAEDDWIDLDEDGVDWDGSFDADEYVDVTGWDLVVTEVEDNYYTSADSAMYRLLLHEVDNVWEDAPNPDMWGFWYSQGTNILWTAINVSGDDSLEAFEDFLSGMVQGATAAEVNASPSTDTKSVKVSWTNLKGAGEYEIAVYDGTTLVDTEFYTVPSTAVAGTTLSKTISGLDYATDYDIFVRVSVDMPYMSRWSASASVVTAWYVLPPDPEVPDQGLQGAPLLPSFVWEAASGAVSYDLQLSISPAFTSTIVDTNITVTGYTCTVELAYDLDHYWRVRSVAADGTKSAWCTIQNFHTRLEPIEQLPPVTIVPPPTPTIILPTPQVTVVPQDITVVPPDITVNLPTPTITTISSTIEMPEEVTPIYIWVIVAIGALLTIAVIVLIIRTRRVV